MRASRLAEVRPFGLAAALLAPGLAVPAAAALRPVLAAPDAVTTCEDEGGNDRLETYCEIREITLPAGRVEVDAAPNGGITVRGESRRADVRVRAKVVAQA